MKRFLLFPTILLFLTLTAWLYLGATLKAIPDVFATGGAFKNTKHGGDNTVDGGVWCMLPPCGVDRSTGAEVGSYFGVNPEAGDYLPGECAHCHEPHSSFGGYGVEPPPTSSPADPGGGPNSYLLFGDNSSEVCWYCHENMSLGLTPPPSPGYGFWHFYQGKNKYTTSSHGTSLSFRWPGDNDLQNPSTIWPRDNARSLSDAGKCINCHTPHGVLDSVANNGYDYGTPASTNYVVGTDPNAAQKEMIPRQLIAREEALCLNCHDLIGPASNIKAQIDKRINDSTPPSNSASGHAVRKYYKGDDQNEHDLYYELNPQPIAGWLTRAKVGWHVECTDCHNPHVASKGPFEIDKGYVFQASGQTAAININRNSFGSLDLTIEPVRIGNVNKGVWGVSVTGTNDGSRHSIIYAYKSQVEFVYELCLKCHSYFGDTSLNVTANAAGTPTAPSTSRGLTDGMPDNVRFTDVGKEFDPDNCDDGPAGTNFWNGAVHPVLGQGCNTPPAYPNAKANPAWQPNSAGTRTDGAPADLSQNFVPPWRSNSYITCVDCHLTNGPVTDPKGPHGSSNYFILRSLDTTIQYTVNDGAGGTIVIDYNLYTNATNPSSGSGLKTNDANNLCLNCHRADVYGYLGQAAQTDRLFPQFARMKHPSDAVSAGGGQSFGHDYGTRPVRGAGILCLRCHGGRILGGIHGMNLSSASSQILVETQGSHAGRAFLYGEAWEGYTMGRKSTGANASCFIDDSSTGWSTCGHHGAGSSYTLTAADDQPQYEWPY